MKTPIKTRSQEMSNQKRDNENSSEWDDEGTSSCYSLPTKSNIGSLQKENQNLGSSEYGDDTTSSSCNSSLQESTISVQTAAANNRHLLQTQHTTTNIPLAASTNLNQQTINAIDDIDNQNMCNKRNEKMNKPCENGFCYCFTSDSDEFRIPRTHHQKQQIFRSSPTKQPIKTRKSHPETIHKKSHQFVIETDGGNSTITSAVSSEYLKIHDSIPLNNNRYERKLNKSTKCQDLSSSVRNYQKLNMNTKTYIDNNGGVTSKDAPLIHIIQEFYQNTVTSEIHINKSKIKKDFNANHEKESHYKDEKTSKTSKLQGEKLDKCKQNSKNHQNNSTNKTHSLNKTKNKKLNEDFYKNDQKKENKGGKLLQKRLVGCQSFHNNYQKSKTPPRKPPRSFSSSSEYHQSDVVPVPVTVTSFQQAEEILDKFLRERSVGEPIMKHSSACQGYLPKTTTTTTTRKSYPLDKTRHSKIKESQFQNMMNINNKPTPSCPFISDVEDQTVKEFENVSKVGWLLPDSDIAKMLNYGGEKTTTTATEFNSLKLIPEPQIGWTVPKKLQLDTVDGGGGINKVRETDNFHNFAKNMESKSTPVKSEFTNNQRKSIIKATSNATATANANDSCLKIDEEEITPKTSKSDLNLSFRKKATSNTKLFLKNSKQKIVEMVTKKADKDNNNISASSRSSSVVLKRNVAVQTSTTNLSTNKKINFESCNNDENVPKISSFSLQSPPGSYFSNSSKKNSPNEFDFNRIINSPKLERSSQRRLTFSPKKLMKTFNYRNNIERKDDKLTDHHQYYKSFESEIDQDFSLSAMNDVLLNIKAKLEASDNHATRVFQEVKDRQSLSPTQAQHKLSNTELLEEQKESYSEYDDLQNLQRISAQAVIHNEPPPDSNYSEIEEERIVVTGNPSIQSLNEVSHYVVNSDVIYAKVNKVRKSQSYNNIREKYSPPKTRQTSKSELWNGNKLFVDNFNNKNINAIEILEESNISEPIENKANDTVDCFASFDDEDKDVTYEESPGEVSYTEIYQSLPEYHSRSYELNKQQPINASISDLGFDVTDDIPIQQTIISSNYLAPNNEHLLKYSSMDDHNSVHSSNNKMDSNKSNFPTSIKYKNIKNKLRDSFRKGKKYFKNETKRISNTMKQATTTELTGNTGNTNKRHNSFCSNQKINSIWDESNLGINELYKESPTIEVQLKKVVTLCRKLPYFETSLEAVEAERLLLYSNLKTYQSTKHKIINNNHNSILIQSFQLPICIDFNEDDIFFNYFYVGVYSFESQIKSTEFGDKQHNIQFRNCNIFFDNLEHNSEVKCDIYLLRLKKILNLKPEKQDELRLKMDNVPTDSSDSELNHSQDLLSRFKLQGSFKLCPLDFVPYKIINNDDADILFLESNNGNNVQIPINLIARNTYLQNHIQNIQANVKLAFKKIKLSGFLNVQDMNTKHNWNHLWCCLDMQIFNIWSNQLDCLDLEQKPILSIDFSKNLQFTVEIADRSLCARPRTFSINIPTNNADAVAAGTLNFTKLFLSADNQNDLKYWMNGFNEIYQFIQTWMIEQTAAAATASISIPIIEYSFDC